jgi:hypothetical protein
MAVVDFVKQAQKYFQKFPTIILGSGASAPFGLSGMESLASHLVKHFDVTNVDDDDLVLWKLFVGSLNAGKDLETALDDVRLSPALTSQVVKLTWELLNPQDIEVFKHSLQQADFFALSKVIHTLFQTANKRIDIVTTNYDRLAEYAAEQAGFYHYSGFSHGFSRTQKPADFIRADRVVNVLKVHGSLDWFLSPFGDVIALNQFTCIPVGHIPQIVTPGIEKYSTTYHEPFRTVIQMADQAIRQNDSYLCVGFGFNDVHIQEKLVEKCVRDDACVTLITWGLSDAAKDFLLNGKIKHYLAIERGETDDCSIIYSSESEQPIKVKSNYWSLAGYLKLIL